MTGRGFGSGGFRFRSFGCILQRSFYVFGLEQLLCGLEQLGWQYLNASIISAELDELLQFLSARVPLIRGCRTSVGHPTPNKTRRIPRKIAMDSVEEQVWRTTRLTRQESLDVRVPGQLLPQASEDFRIPTNARARPSYTNYYRGTGGRP